MAAVLAALSAALLATIAGTSAALAQGSSSSAPNRRPDPFALAPVTKTKPIARVKSCTAFGDGFVYVSATDTCVKLGGYLRLDAGVGQGR